MKIKPHNYFYTAIVCGLLAGGLTACSSGNETKPAASKPEQAEVVKPTTAKEDAAYKLSFGYRYNADLKQTPDSQVRLNKWFLDAKFGVFIHFGAYSPFAGKYKDKIPETHYAEWIQQSATIPKEEYLTEVVQTFNPVDFDAQAWVKVFKDAGARYVVITSKHHDGFALFDSAVSDYNIVDATPFKRDIIKELSEATHRAGMKFGVYYSQAQDWNEPDAGTWKKLMNIHDVHPQLADDFKPDMDRYLATKAIPQVVELVTNYEIDLIWFDTPIGMRPPRAKQLSDVVRKHSPDTLINSRLSNGWKAVIKQKDLELYDYISVGDKEVPDRKLSVAFETPDSVSTSYGYKAFGEHSYHSEKELIERMVHTVCAGGNYLLNNGPMGNGKLDPQAVSLYESIGKWMKLNSESLYDTRANPFDERPEWGDISINKAGDTLYLHILKWPTEGNIALSDLPAKVTAASYLANGSKAVFKQKKGLLNIKLSDHPVDDLNTVIKITLEQRIL